MTEDRSLISKVLVPVFFGRHSRDSMTLASRLSSQVTLAGFVPMRNDAELGAGVKRAREVRKVMFAMRRRRGTHCKSRVRVTTTPAQELERLVERSTIDLLVLDLEDRLKSLSFAREFLTFPSCKLALVRGPFPARPKRILVPVRGGPHAELAVRLALELRPQQLTVLHLSDPSKARKSDAPFRALEKVLKQIPEVEIKLMKTRDPAQTILDQSRGYDTLVMGATAQPTQQAVMIGEVPTRILKECRAAVVLVKNQVVARRNIEDESASVNAITLLVDRWFAENTFHANEFRDLADLVQRKRKLGVTISLALPSLNEEKTIDKVIRTVKKSLMEKVPLLDEIVLIDSQSTDRTREIAARHGVPVHVHQKLLPELGPRRGKGEALWKSLLVTHGDILVWIDTDIVNIHPRFVYGVLGPLLLSPNIQFVKGFYRRPLRIGEKVQAGGGGRVTELMARPMLNFFYPELSGIIQPLSGEYAGRRGALEQMCFSSGYGVETGLLIDIFERYGLRSIAQVDLLERIHHNQPLDALGKMAFVILQTVMRRLERKVNLPLLEAVNTSMKIIGSQRGQYFLSVEDLAELERPPMLEVDAYVRSRRTARKFSRKA